MIMDRISIKPIAFANNESPKCGDSFLQRAATYDASAKINKIHVMAMQGFFNLIITCMNVDADTVSGSKAGSTLNISFTLPRASL